MGSNRKQHKSRFDTFFSKIRRSRVIGLGTRLEFGIMKHAFVHACIVSLAAGCGDMHTESPTIAGDPAPQEEVMKIHFERSGGFAGMTMNVDIDADSLSDTEREALMTHVSNAEFFALPSAIADPSTTGADRYNYRITIESNDRAHTVECTDGSAPASLAPLLDWLNSAARQAQRKPTTKPRH